MPLSHIRKALETLSESQSKLDREIAEFALDELDLLVQAELSAPALVSCTMLYDKATKNTYVYTLEDGEEGPTSLYVPKTCLPAPPSAIGLTIIDLATEA